MNLFLKTAIQAAKAAGKIHKKYYGKTLNVRFKSKNKLNLVTEVDTLCEKKVFSILQKHFPSHNFWGEESGKDAGTSEYTWLVDPLDGTTNYAHAYPFFCCSIALIKKLNPTSPMPPFKTKIKGMGTSPFPLVLSPKDEMGVKKGSRGDLASPSSPEIIIGVIYDALRDECFTAEKGKGAF